MRLDKINTGPRFMASTQSRHFRARRHHEGMENVACLSVQGSQKFQTVQVRQVVVDKNNPVAHVRVAILAADSARKHES